MASASVLTGMDSLPPKDVALFKSTLVIFFILLLIMQKYFEYKQYKKGLKVCEALLKKHPEHGESMAMKGLFLSHLNRKEEGYEQVRQGLKFSLKSHVCWHVFGLLYKADKNYDEAIKCYRNALRFDKENGQILRELAVLQLQTRQYASLVDTRYQLLTLRPVVKLSWVSLAISYHLNGKYEQAVDVLDAIFEGFPLENDSRATYIEQSGLFFYKSTILRESGNFEAAFHALDNFAHVDILELKKRRAELLLEMKKYSEALPMFESLLNYNPDSRQALQGYIRCLREQDSSLEESTILLDLSKRYPSSLLFKSEAIKIATKADLAVLLKDLVLPLAQKGILSSFSIIRRLYKCPDNMPVLNQFCAYLESQLSNADGNATPWLHVLIAQHYSLSEEKDALGKAISNMEAAASLKPDTPEIFLYFAKILRRQGYIKKAAESMDYARRLDLSDRFLNSKTAKYYLRAGRIDEAQKLAVVFVKKGDFEAQLQDLVEMQSLWFALEMGRAHQSCGEHLKALEYFDQIRKHFIDFYEDQFEFHNYVLRKMTLCSYIRLLRYEDAIQGEQEYFKAAKLAITSLVHLHDTTSTSNEISSKMEHLSLDPSGTKSGYLSSALQWVEALVSFHGKDPYTQKLAFDVYRRLGWGMKAARCVILSKSMPENYLGKEDLEAASSLLPQDSPEKKAFVDLLKGFPACKVHGMPVPTLVDLETPILNKLISA